MSALIQALVQDIRTDVLMALDPRVMTKKEATALILLTGWIHQWLLSLLLGPHAHTIVSLDLSSVPVMT
jgi:hypothetical protein